MGEDPGPETPSAIDRWEISGGTWRIAALGEDHAVVELLRCDGGEVVERLVLREPQELRWAVYCSKIE